MQDKRSKIIQFFMKENRPVIFVLLFLLVFSAGTYVFARTQPYLPIQQVLDPSCPPDEVNCFVQINPLNNLTDTSDPGSGDDSSLSGGGYSVGSLWFNTSSNSLFVASDVTPGSAVWVEVGGTGISSVVTSGVITGDGTSGSPITIAQASGSVSGYLSSTDWTSFNSRMLGSNNLSEITSASTARTNLGLGSIAVLNSITDSDISGTISVSHGGTGASSLTANAVLIGNGTSAVTGVTGTDGQILLGASSGSPSFRTISLNSTAGSLALSASGVLTFPDAGAGSRGLVNTAAQSFDGVKTFSNGIVATGTANINLSGSTATNIGTSTYSGLISIGNSSATLALVGGTAWSINSSGDASFATINSGASTFTGDVTLSSATIRGLPTTPSFSDEAVSLSYVTSVLSGLKWKVSVDAATTTTLPSYNYDNGTAGVGAYLEGSVNGALPAIDGVTLVANDRLLVKDETGTPNNAYNGIYIVTTVGDGSTKYKLTRCDSCNEAAEFTNATVAVLSGGTINGGTAWTQINTITTVGTDPVEWTQFLSNSYAAGTGIDITGNTISSKLSTGVAGGQSVVGGTASGNNLTLSSTTHATKGKINFGTGGTSAYDEATARLGIGTTSPTEKLHVSGNIRFSGALMPDNLAGNSGEVLVSQGSGVAPIWQTISSALGSSAFINNGNSFSAAAVLGTNDNNSLSFETNGITRMTIGASGALTLGSASGAGVSIASGAASSFQTTAANLTLGTLTSGNLILSSAGTTTIDGSGAINIGTTSTTALSLGNSSGTFALTSSGGLNVTTGGALTGVASIDTISVSATGLTFATAGTISSSGSSSLTLNGGTSGDINVGGSSTGNILLAGGSSSTGCTVTSNTGALACSAGLTGTTGTFSSGSSLTLGTASTATGSVAFKNATNSNTVTIQSGTTSTGYTLVLPTAAADTGSGSVLTAIDNGSGTSTASWTPIGNLTVSLTTLTAASHTSGTTDTINNANSLIEWDWNSLNSANAFTISSTSSTNLTNTSYASLLNLSFAGTPTSAGDFTYGLRSENANAGAGNNVAVYGLASGTGASVINTGVLADAHGGGVGSTHYAIHIPTTTTSGTNNYAIYADSGAKSYFAGALGLGVSSPSAVLQLKAGTATASTAPLKFTSGTNLTSAETGAVEYNGTQLFFTPASTRNILAQVSGSTALTSGTVPYATSNGYLTSDSSFTYSSGAITLGVAASTNGSITLQNSSNSNTVTLRAGVTTSSYTWTLPTADSSGCLQSNGAGTLSVSTCPSSTLSGGSTGGVAYWASSSTLSNDSSLFFWDSTNKRLGIGTNSPSAFLHLVGTTPGSGSATAVLTVVGATGGTGGNGSAISLTTGTGGTSATTGGAGGAFSVSGGAGGTSTSSGGTGGSGSSFSLTAGAGGAITNSSGFSTGGDGGTFTITGGAGGATNSTGSGSGIGGVGGGVTISGGQAGTTNTNSTEAISGGTVTLMGGQPNTSALSRIGTMGDILLQPTGVTVGTLDGSNRGGVGINTSSVYAPLYVNGGKSTTVSSVSYSTAVGNITLTSTSDFPSAGVIVLKNSEAALFRKTAGSNQIYLANRGMYGTSSVSGASGDASSYHVFSIVNNTGGTPTTNAPHFVVTSAGRTGIGTAAPTAVLNVVGSTSSSGAAPDVFAATGGTGAVAFAGGGFSFTGGSSAVSTSTAGTGGAFIVTGGAGGNSTSSSNNATGTGGEIRLTAGAGGNNTSTTGSAGNGKVGGAVTIKGGAGGDASSATSTNALGGKGGSVAITGGTGGTNGAVASGVAYGGDITITGGTGGTTTLGPTLNGGNVTINGGAVGSGGSGGGSIGTVLLQTTGGYLGIGTSSPAAKLDLNGDFRLRGSTSGYVAMQAPATVTSYTWTLPSADASGCISSNGSGTLSISACSTGAVLTTTNQTVAGTKTFSSDIKIGTGSDLIVAGYGGGSVTTNTVFGVLAGSGSNSGTGYNNWFGYNAGANNTSGSGNIGIGENAGNAIITGNYNTVVGDKAMSGSTSASITIAENTVIGASAGNHIAANGAYNLLLGSLAGTGITSGSKNIVLATYNGTTYGGAALTTGGSNVYIGGWNGMGATDSNRIALSDGSGNLRMYSDSTGTNFGGDLSPNALFTVGNTSQFQVNSSGAIAAATGITSSGTMTFSGLVSCAGLQTNGSGVVSCTSDENYKDVVSDFTAGLDAILKINPKTYTWKEGTYLYDGGVHYSGFIAQNVQAAFPEGVSIGSEGQLQLSTTAVLAATVNAIKDLNVKLEVSIEDLKSLDETKDGSLAHLVLAFLENAVAKIKELTVGTLKIDEKVCVDEVCVTKDQFKQLLINAQGTSGGGSTSGGSTDGGSTDGGTTDSGTSTDGGTSDTGTTTDGGTSGTDSGTTTDGGADTGTATDGGTDAGTGDSGTTGT